MGGDVVCEEFYFGYLPKLQQRLYKVIYQELRKCNQKILVCAPVETVKRVYMAVLRRYIKGGIFIYSVFLHDSGSV